MKIFLVSSVVLLCLASFIFSQQANAVPVSYNTTGLNIPWVTVPRNSTVIDLFIDSANNGTITHWYHTTIGGSSIIKKIGSGGVSYNFPCSLTGGGLTSDPLKAIGPNIFYICGGGPASMHHFNIFAGSTINDFSNTCVAPEWEIFPKQNAISLWCFSGTASIYTTYSGNFSLGSGTFSSISNEKIIGTTPVRDRWNGNTTNGQQYPSTNPCEFSDVPQLNTTITIPNIACDVSLQANDTRYFDGMQITKVGNVYTNSTLPLFNSINASPYVKILTMPAIELGLPPSDTTMFILHNGTTNNDLMVAEQTNAFYYVKASYLKNLLTQNRATQQYMTTILTQSSNYELLSGTFVPIKIYGFNTNQTMNYYGMMTLVSGYTTRLQASPENNFFRTIDPRWTNNNIQYPAVMTASSVFNIFLTVSNAPTDAALMLVDGGQAIQSQNSLWCVTQLDSTHSAECDVPANQCPLVFVADISVTPTVFLYQGSVCATGPTQKTIAYIATLPIAWYNFKYGSVSSFVPSTNMLTVTTRAATPPFTYNVLVKNSTGIVTINKTYSVSGIVDIRNYNLTNSSKSASLYVSVPGQGTIYTASLGSPISLASVAAFFHQYFNYQGFDLLSFLPLIFASAFTRNTVGIGCVLVVIFIATLSWLSVVVVPDIIIFVSVVVAIMGMIGYRSIYG